MGIYESSIKKKKDACISHNFRSLEEVTEALRKEGLESSNLIIGIDFTKINERTDSFNNRSLHSINGGLNPYEQVIYIVGKTLEPFNKDNLIPCFGFGDATTFSQEVFSFHNDHSSCHGFKEVLSCYKEIVPNVRLAGRTSFAPVIEAAIDIVERSGGQYHVLVIIVGGEVTRSVDTSELSPQEEKTIRSIVNASLYPLSIIVVGVGDGPWEDMRKFVNKIPAREFDNFQFIDFGEIIDKNVNWSNKEALFALAALMSIPFQYEEASRLGILRQVTGKAKKIDPRPPPTSYDHKTSNLSRIMDGGASQMVSSALRKEGFKSSNLILGIDFTKSNEWTGKVSFNSQSLHTIATFPNPYQQVISIIANTWATFGEENVIPCFGFGDKITNDQEVFSFHDDESSCCGFDEVITCYKRIVQCVELGGPTSFAPIIEVAIDIVERSGGHFHVLVIIADGQVTRSVNTSDKALSEQEEISIASILDASSHPLSIIVVGVGDGPWDNIKKFVGKIPAREFHLFQAQNSYHKFINFTEIMSKTKTLSEKEALFAIALLEEITIHYKAAIEFGLLGQTTGKAKKIVPRPPPTFYAPHASTIGEASNLSRSMVDKSHGMPLCPICLTHEKDMAFGCGHMTCRDCGSKILSCAICRQLIVTRLRIIL